MKRIISVFLLFVSYSISFSQNLVVDGTISNNANWNGQEAPFNAGTFESTYLVGACNTNYVMEVDNASSPQQVVNGFMNAKQYVLSFRCAYRNNGCAPSNNPTTLQMQFTDATGVLTYTLSIPNTQVVLTAFSFTFTNDAATSHTLRCTNPGNVNTCGVIVDDISISLLSSPGGLGTTNLSFWLKANSINQVDNTSVNGWLSSGINVLPLTPPCAARPVYKTGLASVANNLVANYNPYLTFNGTTQYLQYITARVDLYNNSPATEGGSFFAVYQGGAAARTYFNSRCANNSRTWARTNLYVYPNGAGAGTNNQATIANSTRDNVVVMVGKSNGLTVADLKGTNVSLGNNAGDVDHITVGVRRTGAAAYGEFFNSSLSEIIIYNTILSNTDLQKVRCYLASKYGVTLNDNTTTAGIDERDYIASDATNYWSFTANTAYHNNLTVIGRDDDSQLSQPKSISTDADAGSNTGNGMLIVDNVAAISADRSYFATGHDGTAVSAGADFIDVPVGIQSRLRRHWKYQKTGTGIAASVQVSFDMTGFSPLTGSDLRLLVSGTSSFAGASIIAGAYAAPYFTASLPTTGGVFFTVASINSTTTPLPVELLSFTATPKNETVQLNWSTATEVNNDFFTLLRSADAISFNEIGQVKGSGNSNTIKNYEFIDTNPLNGTSYYKLRQTDFNKKEKEFNMVSVTFEKQNGKTVFSIFPNPNSGDFTIDFSGIENNHEVLVTLRDEKGKEVYNNVFYSQSIDHNLVELHMKEKLSKGLYFCTFSAEGVNYTVKVVVN